MIIGRVRAMHEVEAPTILARRRHLVRFWGRGPLQLGHPRSFLDSRHLQWADRSRFEMQV